MIPGEDQLRQCDLLLEIGVEEIPVESITIAVDYLRQSFEKLLLESKLSFGKLLVSSTPRRLVLLAESLDSRQQDLTLLKTGPSLALAFDAAGNPGPAALGFLKKNNASVADLITETTDKGQFIAIRQEIPGKSTPELIGEWFPRFLNGIAFPKKMIWDSFRPGFIRPLRWILALWDDQVLPLSAYGLSSSNLSYGNRYLGLDHRVTINCAAEYFPLLEEARVLANREQRKNLILEQLKSITPEGEQVEPDPRLVDTVTDLVEFPNAVLASFDPAFLSLPDKIITSTISQNQKYFGVYSAEGELTNHFVFISNGNPAHRDLIRRGNEKVVHARLSDAMWYYREDTRKPLENYLPALQDIVFQAKLGTVAEKCDRIGKLAQRICDQLQFDSRQKALAGRAALLCKADLVTTMLGEKEFTKLQGYIGKQYALAGGEDPEVAQAIFEHYMPRGQGDSLPETVSGAVLAIADKVDTVCGIISIGMMPSGSGDPYALRRAAGGVVQILASRDWNIDLDDLSRFAVDLITHRTQVEQNSVPNVDAFFRGRLKWLLQQYNIDYDVIDSVMHIDSARPVELRYRALALQSARLKPDFIKLVIGFKRVSNIIAEAGNFVAPDPGLFQQVEETALHTELMSVGDKIANALTRHDYPLAIDILVNYGSYIDSFFDAVLVNTDDQSIRANRYGLLNLVRKEFLKVADLSLLVIE